MFFNKQRSHIETVNDIDEEIVNFFRILRDRSDELERAIEFTPFSRSEYKAAYEPSYNDLEKDISMDPEQYERLMAYCRQQDRPISWVIRQALDNYLPV